MGPRAEQILPRSLGPPVLRPGRLATVLRRRGGQPGPSARGLGRGGLRGSPGPGDGGLWPPGHFSGQGCLCHAGKPPLPGLQDEGGRRVRPAVGLRHGWNPVGEPPVQPPGGGGDEGGPGGLPDAGHRPGVSRPQIPVVGRIVCPVPQTVAVPAGPPRVPPGGQGPDASPQVADLGLPAGLPGGGTGTHAPATPACPPPNHGPPGVGGAPGSGPGSTTHDGAPPHRHAAPRESPWEGGVQAGRATLPSNGDTRERPHHPVPDQAPPLLAGPPTSARRALFNQQGAAQSRSDAPAQAVPPQEVPAPRGPQALSMATDPETVRGDVQGYTGEAPRDPPEAPMETDLEPTHVGKPVGTRDTPPSAAGPMETDGPSSGGQTRVPSQPSTPRSRPRSTAPTHPSGMWFCPMPRCARREGASPTGWGCLQSLVSHPARCTCRPVRPRRMRGLTSMVSECAWPAERSPRKGHGARDHAAPRRSWRHWPWATRPPLRRPARP